MVSKQILVCFLIVLSAVQGQPTHNKYVKIDYLDSPRDTIEDIIIFINELVEKVEGIIETISSKLSQIISDLEAAVKSIIEGLHIADTIDEIKKVIASLTGLSPEEIGDCLAAESDAISQLAKDTQSGIQKCVQSAQSQDAELREQIDKLVQKSAELITDIKDRAAKCIKDNITSISGMKKCIEEQIDPIKAEIADLEDEVEKTIQVAEDTVGKVTAELTKCLQQVAEDASAKEHKIADDIISCAAGNANTTSA